MSTKPSPYQQKPYHAKKPLTTPTTPVPLQQSLTVPIKAYQANTETLECQWNPYYDNTKTLQYQQHSYHVNKSITTCTEPYYDHKTLPCQWNFNRPIEPYHANTKTLSCQQNPYHANKNLPRQQNLTTPTKVSPMPTKSLPRQQNFNTCIKPYHANKSLPHQQKLYHANKTLPCQQNSYLCSAKSITT